MRPVAPLSRMVYQNPDKLGQEIMQSILIASIFKQKMIRNDFSLGVKGGFAMRLQAGSHRLTDDIDLQATGDVRVATLGKIIERAVDEVSRVPGVRVVDLKHAKDGDATQRYIVRLQKEGGPLYKIKIEVSMRATSQQEDRHVSYSEPHIERMKPDENFMGSWAVAKTLIKDADKVEVECYGVRDMFFSKMYTLSSRTKARDLWDLKVLMDMEVEPRPESLDAVPRHELERWLRDMTLVVDSLNYEHFKTELVDFLPAQTVKEMTEERWDEMRLGVLCYCEKIIRKAESRRGEMSSSPGDV